MKNYEKMCNVLEIDMDKGKVMEWVKGNKVHLVLLPYLEGFKDMSGSVNHYFSLDFDTAYIPDEEEIWNTFLEEDFVSEWEGKVLEE